MNIKVFIVCAIIVIYLLFLLEVTTQKLEVLTLKIYCVLFILTILAMVIPSIIALRIETKHTNNENNTIECKDCYCYDCKV